MGILEADRPALNQATPFSSYATLELCPNCPAPRFPHLWNGDRLYRSVPRAAGKKGVQTFQQFLTTSKTGTAQARVDVNDVNRSGCVTHFTTSQCFPMTTGSLPRGRGICFGGRMLLTSFGALLAAASPASLCFAPCREQHL